MRAHVKKLLVLLVASLVGGLGIVAQIPQVVAADDGHPYTTPGEREYQGRQWRTTCQKYSSTVERCRAEIMATQVDIVDGKYQFVNRYAFNNLTYLPSNRNDWKSNPLATDGLHTIDGRAWQTMCFDDWTGPNGCRSFILTSVIEATATDAGWSFAVVDKWLFNNVVQFTPVRPTPTPEPEPEPLWDNPCNAKPPAGFTFTKEGRPHVIKTPYEPNTHYNPISLANFTQVVLAAPIVNPGTNVDPKTVYTHEDKLCMALLGANHLIAKKEVKTDADGRESWWFPYPFEFDANPAVDNLQPGWYSGLGQAGALTAFMRLYNYTKDSKWLEVAEKIYHSYFVPIEEGGFTNRANGFVWFEEYPTTLTDAETGEVKSVPTVVNNGHFENVLALGVWLRDYPDPEGQALYDAAIEGLKQQIPNAEVELEGGIMTSYELIRGYAAAPLRAVDVSPAGQGPAHIEEALLNGDLLNTEGDTTLPFGQESPANPNLVTNSTFILDGGRVPIGWTIVNNNRAGVTLKGDGWVGVHPQGTMWAGLQQIIPASELRRQGVAPGARLSFGMNSRLEIEQNADGTYKSGTGGKVAIYSDCVAGGKTVTTLIHENARNRSKQTSFSRSDFIAPPANCDIRIQLLTFSYGVTTSTAWYNNVTLRLADPVGSHVAPEYLGMNLLVHQRPQTIVTVKGEGRVKLQAYADGRWDNWNQTVTLTPEGVDVVLPERFTGRNINYNYHDGHVTELQQIACQTGDKWFDDRAKDWALMSAGTPYRTPASSCNLEYKVIFDPTTDTPDTQPLVISGVQEEMPDKPAIMPRTVVMPDGSGATLEEILEQD